MLIQVEEYEEFKHLVGTIDQNRYWLYSSNHGQRLILRPSVSTPNLDIFYIDGDEPELAAIYKSYRGKKFSGLSVSFAEDVR